MKSTCRSLTAVVLVLAAMFGCGENHESPTNPLPASTSGPTSATAVSATTAAARIKPPVVTAVKGKAWTYPDKSFACSNRAWKDYLQVPYDGYPDRTLLVSVTGKNLETVTGVTSTARGYEPISIVSQNPTTLTLDIRATVDETEANSPLANFPLSFNYPGGSVAAKITPGVIPTFNADNQAWGQCTWYAGYLARLRAGEPTIASYGSPSFVPLSGDPNSAGFPEVSSILSWSKIGSSVDKHMNVLETIVSTSKTKRDGSLLVTYTISGSQYNWDCAGSPSRFNATMIVHQWVDAAGVAHYDIATPVPTLGSRTSYRLTHVAQPPNCVFRPTSITDSGGTRSPIPVRADQGFRTSRSPVPAIPITDSGLFDH